MVRKQWTLDAMQEYMDNNNIGYEVKENKWVEKPYQRQMWAKVKCKNENHKPYWIWWNNFIHGYRCKQCDYDNNNKIMWTKEMAYDYIKNKGYIMLDINDFKNVDNFVYCKDKENYIYKISITNLRNIEKGKQNKFSLFKNNKFAINNIHNYCKLHKNDYDIVSTEFKTVKDEYEFIYYGDFNDNKKHNRIFKCTFDSFYHGNIKHPDLTMSKGEIKCQKYFKDNNIEFIPQMTFEGCKDKQHLPFDFYLPKYNIVVEFMGKQHKYAYDYFGGQKMLEYTQKHDKIKREYLDKNNIKYIDIWYYNYDNIEKILDKFIYK